VLVLEVERDDGWTEHDSMVIDVVAPGPLASTTDWAPRWFVPVVGNGTVSFTVTPDTSAQNAYAALADRHRVSDHPDNAIIVRTNDSGEFEAYDGDHYAADTAVSYQSGQSYQVGVTFDLTAQQYSVTVDGTAIATDFAFRHQASAIGQLTAWHATGGLTVDDVLRSGPLGEPDEPCRDDPPVGGAGGTAGSGGSSTTGGSGGAPSAPGLAPEDDSGCGCTLIGSRSSHAALSLAAFGLWLLRRRRTR